MAQIELQRIITGDGLTYWINPNTKVRYNLTSTPAGFGLPSVDYVRTRSYQQDGESELAFYFQPRLFSISVGGQGCSRQELWQLRQDLLNATRPNRMGQATFVFTQPDTTEYAIEVRITANAFNALSNEEWNEFGYTDELEFEAIGPFWRSFASSVASGTSDPNLNLVFPITFPIVFGSGNVWGNAAISYTGTIYAYPVITITGPIAYPILTNVETGYLVQWNGVIAAGASLTFDLRLSYDNGVYVGKRIYDQNGDSQFNSLSPDSNLNLFRIEPDGVVTGGVNTIQLEGTGTDGNTAFTVTYNTMLVGL